MDFARKQLEKYGWKDGKGLGRREDGISEALKPKLKFDNSGVGHEIGEQFTNNWWERVFDNASKNINVRVEADEVRLDLNSEPVEISTKSYSVRDFKNNKDLEYGSFLKSARLTEGGTESFNVAAPEPLPFHTLTDEELFLACEGRTAHKGARHGLKLSGKLSRIEKQEKLLLKKMKNVTLTDDLNYLEKKIKKLKKHKDESTEMVETEPSTSTGSKKKKNKRKVSFNSETVVKYYTPDLDSSHESGKDEEGPQLVDANSNICDEGIEQDIEDCSGDLNDTHRSFEEVQRTFNDLSKAERKKLKKKRKLEKKKKKSATVQFIEEVREEMLIEENHKKRKLVIDEMDVETVQKQSCNNSKKKKYVPEKAARKKEKREKMMNSIVESMDSFCRISDDE